jgi:hypothetical protein
MTLTRPLPKNDVPDTQLRSMKALAAHVRLLLDTPEHLWRLIEQKRYLHATWLFLLARMVHRSLANNDPDEDDVLRNQGIDVMVCIRRIAVTTSFDTGNRINSH